MTRSVIVLLFFLFTTHLTAQGLSQVSGIIRIKDATPLGVHVLNISNERESRSDKDGKFAIEAQIGDVLVFAAPNLDYYRILVEEEHLSGVFYVDMTSRVQELDEVEIESNRINALALGILSKPAKKYTPAEAKLYTATSGLLDGLINAWSGRKKMLENDVKTERKNYMLQDLEGLFPEQFYREDLKIKPENIKRFHYFLVESVEFQQALKSENKHLLTLVIIETALKFNERQADGDN